MRKNSHFSGLLLYRQLIKLLDKSKFLIPAVERMVRSTLII